MSELSHSPAVRETLFNSVQQRRILAGELDELIEMPVRTQVRRQSLIALPVYVERFGNGGHSAAAADEFEEKEQVLPIAKTLLEAQRNSGTERLSAEEFAPDRPKIAAPMTVVVVPEKVDFPSGIDAVRKWGLHISDGLAGETAQGIAAYHKVRTTLQGIAATLQSHFRQQVIRVHEHQILPYGCFYARISGIAHSSVGLVDNLDVRAQEAETVT